MMWRIIVKEELCEIEGFLHENYEPSAKIPFQFDDVIL